MVLDCCCVLCVISTHLQIVKGSEKQIAQVGGGRLFPTYLLYMKGTGECAVISVPQKTDAFERGEMKGE